MPINKREPAPKTSASFTSWKLRLLNAAGADPRIPPTYFRFLVRVIQALNEESRIAMIGDDVIADEVPGFAQQSTRNRARRALAELGYLSYDAGQGSKVTRYRISDEPVPAILVAIEEARERRAAEREARKQAFRDQSKPALVQGTNQTQPCKSHLSKPAPVQGVHLQDTPSPKGYREQDGTQGVHEGSPPRCQCGEVAVRLVRDPAFPSVGNWRPQCQECAEDWFEMPGEENRAIELDDAYRASSRG